MWRCDASDFEGMGRTYRPGIGLRRLPGESWPEAAARQARESTGPILARWLAATPEIGDGRAILDFGCGAGAVQVRGAWLLGITSIVGYEWPPEPGDVSKRAGWYWESVRDGAIDPDALERTYDVVLASNVLNVQPTWGCMFSLLATVRALMAPGALFVANLASEPRPLLPAGRKGDTAMERVLAFAFDDLWRVEVPAVGGGRTSTAVWACKSPRRTTFEDEHALVRNPAGDTRSDALAKVRSLARYVRHTLVVGDQRVCEAVSRKLGEEIISHELHRVFGGISLVHGWFDARIGPTTHAWLVFDDGTMVDITADQFGAYPKVWVPVTRPGLYRDGRMERLA